MSAKHPERKETGEWAKHLRPKRKKSYWRNARREAKRELSGRVSPGKDGAK